MRLSASQIAAYLAAFTIVLGTGLVHGVWTRRWAEDQYLEQVSARVRGLPLDAGDWHAQELEVEPGKLARAEVAGYLFRRYTNRSTGQSINLILLWGRFGPLAVHTPDVCFGGAGFETLDPATAMTVPSDGSMPATLWTALFERKTGPLSQFVRAFWGWNAGSGWQAPRYPRLVFRGAPVLFKLYVVRDLARADEPIDAEPGVSFLRQILPALDAVVAGPG
jgi:hypothetical protein